MATEEDEGKTQLHSESLDPYKVHLKGLTSSITKENVKAYIQSLSDQLKVQDVCLGHSGDALVTFTDQPDFESLERSINRDKKGLEGSQLTVERIPYCRCILVTGLSRMTTKDAIKFYFENPRTGCGEEPSEIELEPSLGKARIQFKDHSALEKLLGKRHVLDEVELQIEPFYPFLGQEICPKKIDVNPDVMAYIKKDYDKEFQEVLEENGLNFQWTPKEISALVIERNTIPREGNHDINRVEKLLEFLEGFDCRVFPVNGNLYEDIAEGLHTQIDARNIDLSENAQQFSFKIVGKKQFIVHVAKQIEMLIEEVTEDMRIKESVVTCVEDDISTEKLAVLGISNLIDHIQESYKYTNVHIDEEKCSVVIQCPENKVQEIKAEVLRFLSKVDKELVRLSERILQVFLTPKGKDYVVSALKKENVVAVLIIDDERKPKHEALIYGMNSDHCAKGLKLIQFYAKEKFIRLEDESMQVVKKQKWKDLVTEQKNDLVVDILLESKTKTVWISGVEQDVNKCYANVKEHLDKYTILQDYVEISTGSLKYLFKVWNDKVKKLKEELRESFLKIEPNYKEMQIQLSGNQNGITTGKEKLKIMIGKIRHEKIIVEKPGMAKFFKSAQGSKHIKIVESENSCTVEMVEGKVDVMTDQRVYSSIADDFDDESKVIYSCTTDEGKMLYVCKDDLTEHPADVIVNAANNQLKHIGGLAGAIVRAGGQEIQDECDKYITENGPLSTGKVMETDAGKLPCKKICHAVGPRWSKDAGQKHRKGQKTNEESLLYKTIQNCLLLAQDYNSIAIPAISSGIFGFPLDLCASTLIQSVMDFFRQNPYCGLSVVRFTNNDEQTVNAFEAEIKRVFDHDSMVNGACAAESEPEKPPDSYQTKIPKATALSDDSTLLTPEGISISVKVGDIAQENSDVLVNTTGDQLNLQNNACAKSFSAAAGPDLQRYCDAIAPIQVGDIGVTMPGNLKCKLVFHAVCGEWKNGSGQQILCGILEKCLKEAENQVAKSISFPAIGTGVLGFPRDVVAKISFDEVIKFSRKFPNSHLKEVRFMVYHLDQQTVTSFQDELSKRIPNVVGYSQQDSSPKYKPSEMVESCSVPDSVKTRKPKLFEIKLGQLTVQVQIGDITQEKTDTIGMLSDPMLRFEHQGTAWAAIVRAAGQNVIIERNELDYLLPLPCGQAVVYPAGNLQVRNLIICSASNIKETSKISRSLVSCLQKAEKEEFKSISFPAFGTGIFGLTSKKCASVMMSAAKRFSETKPKSMQLIRIIVFQEVVIEDFIAEMGKYSGSGKETKIKRLWGWLKKGVRSLSARNKKGEDVMEADSVMSLDVYSGSPTSLRSAVRAINDIMKDKSVSKKIEKEDIADIEEAQINEMCLLERQLDCKITVDKENCVITVEGLSDDILKATTDIYDMLHKIAEAKHERTKAESIAKDVEWQYETDDVFTPYSIGANAKIETAFANKEEFVNFEENGEELTIRFGDMIEISSVEGVDWHTNVKRKNLRLGGVSMPDHWAAQPKTVTGEEKGVHLVELDSTSREFFKVKDLFSRSCSGNHIVKISRVQNPEQYKIYSIRKQKMDDKSGSNEKQLFHGTGYDSCEGINLHGFNRSYCGKNATVYGAGVYFAVDAEYSARPTYSPPDARGIRYMYLARVLTGEYTKGNRTMIVPPPKNPSQPNERYDTVVDKLNNPKIFVVFKDGQAYPEYLIEFR